MLLSLELPTYIQCKMLHFYVSEAIYGYIVWVWKESLLTPTHGEFYANKECLTKWFIKKVSFTFQLFTNETSSFSHLWNHTCLHSSSAHSTFLMDFCWIQPSYGWFHSHIGGCDNVILGLWHTWINNTPAWQTYHIVMRDKAIREHWISASYSGICTTALLSQMWIY